MNAIGGCCGTTPEHIAAIRAMASAYPARERHAVTDQLRLSGLEPLNYAPDASNMRRTFLNIGERCNVAGSIIYKKAIVDGDYDKAMSIALSQVGGLWGWLGCGSEGVDMRRQASRQPSGQGAPCRTLLLNACAAVLSELGRHSTRHPNPCNPIPGQPRRWRRAPTCWTSTWTMA